MADHTIAANSIATWIAAHPNDVDTNASGDPVLKEEATINGKTFPKGTQLIHSGDRTFAKVHLQVDGADTYVDYQCGDKEAKWHYAGASDPGRATHFFAGVGAFAHAGLPSSEGVYATGGVESRMGFGVTQGKPSFLALRVYGVYSSDNAAWGMSSVFTVKTSNTEEVGLGGYIQGSLVGAYYVGGGIAMTGQFYILRLKPLGQDTGPAAPITVTVHGGPVSTGGVTAAVQVTIPFNLF